jgi:choline dehydrogenase-like flavoprotein
VFVDARQLEDGSHTASEVCVVGAGPAGLAIALELAGGPERVSVVESGGLAADPWADGLGRLGADGNFFPPANARHRQLGGTANVWDVRVTRDGGGCRFVPLDEIDLESRAAVPYSGWPVSSRDLAPFYARALRRCGVTAASFRLEDCVAPGFAPLPLDGGRVVTTIERFGPADAFTRQARATLEQAANVTVLLHATVAALEVPPGGDAVTRVTAVCADGRRHTINASLFVLAAGGIENPRLLLLSGLGNRHDLVGRFFMDHHNVRAGFLVPAERGLLERTALYDLRQVRGTPIMGKLRVAEGLRREAGLLNAAARLEPGRAPLFMRTRRSLEPGSGVPRSMLPLALVRDVVADAPWLAAAALRRLTPDSARGLYGWSELRAKRWRFDGFHVELQVEHAPDPQNRVRLSDERDALGSPRAAVHWRWTSADLESLRRTARILADECTRAGIGRLVLPPPDAPPVTTAAGGIHHHLGTTRMHDDERRGVVDAGCRVHGVRNLFVAGSSVFPTGGYANPTLTIVALAIRLAEHLKRLMPPRP